MRIGDLTSAKAKSDTLSALTNRVISAANGEAMSEEQGKAEDQEVIQYAEEVDQELTQLRVAVWDLIDNLDVTGGFVELEAGRGSDGPVVRLCRMTSKPLPPRLKAWLDRSGSQ